MQRGPMMIQQPPLSPIVKKLMIINVGVWVIFQLILGNLFTGFNIVTHFGLIPYSVMQDFKIWQVFTYMFLHSNDIFHLPFNMLLLWFIGSELELRWGSRFFLSYYLVCGIGAALIYLFIYGVIFALGYQIEVAFVPVIGASGAIFGLLLAYGILFGERIIYFLLIFPMKAKVFVAVIGLFELYMVLRGGQAGVANLAHIGGLVSGMLYLWYTARRSMGRKKKAKTKNRPNLHLVIDNDKPDDDSSKYWH